MEQKFPQQFNKLAQSEKKSPNKGHLGSLFEGQMEKIHPILKQKKYRNIYNSIYQTSQKLAQQFKHEELQKQEKIIKNSIQTRLRLVRTEQLFNQKFSIAKKIKKKLPQVQKNQIGLTRLEQSKLREGRFFSQDKRGANLQEQSILTQYFLKDQEKIKTKTDYLQRRTKTSQHRRSTANSVENAKLFAKHSNYEYCRQKKRVYINHEQLVQKATKAAFKNYSFRREINFSQMQYIIDQNFMLLMNTSAPVDARTPRIKPQQFLALRRLFLGYACVSQVHKSYYDYIDLKGIDKLLALLLKHIPKLKENDAKHFVQKIIKHKSTNDLAFAQFRELLELIDCFLKLDCISILKIQAKQLFIQRQEIIINQNMQAVNKYLQSHNLQFLLQAIFNFDPLILLDKEYLPLRQVLPRWQHFGLTSQKILPSRLIYCHMWVQSDARGINFQQFCLAILILFIKAQNWKNIKQILSIINIQKVIAQ